MEFDAMANYPIYAMLRECSMDPNKTAQKLHLKVSQGDICFKVLGVFLLVLRGLLLEMLLHFYDIKSFVVDVKPAFLSALEAEYEKNPFEGVAVAPKKTVKALDSMSFVFVSGLDGLPREDISANITPNRLKNLGSPDWKVWLESIESVNKILEEANKRI